MDIATKDQFLSKKYRKFYFDPQKYCSKYLDFHVKTQLFLVKNCDFLNMKLIFTTVWNLKANSRNYVEFLNAMHLHVWKEF